MPFSLPAQLPPERLLRRIGLISDTHMPERCAVLPPAIFSSLDGVDLLLHAGDVGELEVLDRLGVIAPVVAVHGNDDTAEAQRELPYQQLVVVAGQRILLWHSHFSDQEEERSSRSNDFTPGLDRLVARAVATGASIVVFGHWHLPVVVRREGILLVNPGAIASPNPVTRQSCRTVALLFLDRHGTPFVSHVDLARPGQPYAPQIDWAGGFSANLETFSPSILPPVLRPHFAWLVPQERAGAFWAAVLRVARRCWAGELPLISAADLLGEMDGQPEIPPETLGRLAQIASEEAG
jgi:putative phosphoesterase